MRKNTTYSNNVWSQFLVSKCIRSSNQASVGRPKNNWSSSRPRPKKFKDDSSSSQNLRTTRLKFISFSSRPEDELGRGPSQDDSSHPMDPWFKSRVGVASIHFQIVWKGAFGRFKQWKMDQNLIIEDFAIITIKRVSKILQEKLTMSVKLGKSKTWVRLDKTRKIEKMKFVQILRDNRACGYTQKRLKTFGTINCTISRFIWRIGEIEWNSQS